MKTAMHFGFFVMLILNPFRWKACVPLCFAHLYSVDDPIISIPVLHAPA